MPQKSRAALATILLCTLGLVLIVGVRSSPTSSSSYEHIEDGSLSPSKLQSPRSFNQHSQMALGNPQGFSGKDDTFYYKTGRKTDEIENPNVPKVEVFLKNFAGQVVKDLVKEQVDYNGGNGSSDNENGGGNNAGGSGGNGGMLIVTLPGLKIEDHLWEGKSISLECASKRFPVFWDYRGAGKPRVQVSSYRRAPDFYNVSSYSYGASVTFSHSDFKQTGEYVCKGVGGAQIGLESASVYIFVPGNNNLFVSKPKDSDTPVVVQVNDEDPWITLPCMTTYRNASVGLFVYSSSNRNLEQVKDLGSSFDPAEGFRLKWKGFPNPWREYVCKGQYSSYDTQSGSLVNKQEKLHIILKPSGSNSKSPSQIYGGNGPEDSEESTDAAKVAFSYDSKNERILCCSSSRRKGPGDNGGAGEPEMRLKSCTSITDCFMTRRLLESEEFCQPEYFYSCQNKESGNNGANYDEDSMIKVSPNCLGYELLEVDHSGVLQCQLPGTKHKALFQFSYSMDSGLIGDFTPENAPATDKILKIGREVKMAGNKRPSTHGNPNPNSPNPEDNRNKAIYFCNPNPFFFSLGIKWAIQTQDEHLHFLHQEIFPTKSSIEVDESLETGIKQVFCFAPVWDSTDQWRNVSILVPR